MNVKKIKSENDVLTEAAKYLSFLDEKFSSALRRINANEFDFEIVESLIVKDIYSKEELSLSNFKLDPNRVDLFVASRRRDISYPFETFLDITRIVCLERTDMEVEFDEELGWGFGEYDATSKLLTQFSWLYLEKVESLISYLIASNLKEHWKKIYEHKSSPLEVSKSLERIETNFSNQRDICTFYFELISRVKDNNVAKEIDLTIDENWWAYSHLFEGEEMPKDQREILGYSDPFGEEIAIAEMKGAHFFLKFTLLEDRDTFLNSVTALLKTNDVSSNREQQVSMFVDNNFHFNNSIYTTKIKPHDRPPIRANELAVLLRIYLDNSKLIGATKKDVIAWLAHEFYGTRGFKVDNLKAYMERTALTKKHMESGNLILKEFGRKQSQK
jgi:hypothetical protein